MLQLFEKIKQVAPLDIPILIFGESGTGKELTARAIHKLSKRSLQPFVPVNTGAISPDLIVSELFGHEKGSFTGALTRGLGKFELAQEGSLFLDEIGTMNSATQIALLRVLETGRFQRLGGQSLLTSNARIIAATNENLLNRINEGSFREDLYHRLNVFPLRIPPLRERIEDIPVLLDFFVQKYCKEFSLRQPHFTKSAIEKLKTGQWTGNVREFENTVLRLLVTRAGGRIGPDNIPGDNTDSNPAETQNITIEIGTNLRDSEKRFSGKLSNTPKETRKRLPVF